MLLRRGWLIGVAAGALAASAGFGLALRQRAESDAHVAYFGLSKNFRGAVEPGTVARRDCKAEDVGVQMLQQDAAMTLEVGSNAPCDELRRLFNGRMNVRWRIRLRNDVILFGTHAGEWEIRDAEGNVARGAMEGTVGCGTHRAPNLPSCERCRLPLHVEGMLTGGFVSGPLLEKYGERARVRAGYAGRLRGQFPHITAIAGSLDGVLILPCPRT